MSQPSLDVQAMTLIAESAAKTAAEAVSRELSEKLEAKLDTIEKSLSTKIENEFRLRFGDMKPEDHIIAHSRMNRLLDWMDQTQSTVWKGLVSKTVNGLIYVALAGFALYGAGKVIGQ